MGKENLSGSMDSLFGKRGATTVVSEQQEEPKSNRKKVLPDNFKKTNYIMDPEIIKKFKSIAVMNEISVNLLANEVIGKYVEDNFR